MSRQAISLHLPNCKAYASLVSSGTFFTQNGWEPGGLKLAEGLPSFLLVAGRSAQDNSSRLFIVLCATVRTTHRQSLQFISAKMQTF